MKKKIVLLLNLIIIALIFLGNYFYISSWSRLLKGLCSGGFALIGIVNLILAISEKYKNIKFHIIMTTGFILAMLGDLFINSGSGFILGAGFFALGHICYAISYCFLQNMKKLDIIISGTIFALGGSFIFFSDKLNFSFQPIFKYVCIVYALIISVMAGKAISNLICEKAYANISLAVGSILFVISDLILVLNWFMDTGSWSSKLCMATYYPAQCMLAFSTYLILIKKREVK